MNERTLHHPAASGPWRENEEQAWRLWLASARRAAVSAKHKRHTAAEIYWRSAFDIALANLQRSNGCLFSPVHLLEPLQGLVNLLLEQGKWMAARSLFNEVSDFLSREGIFLTGVAERVLHAIAQRVAQAQRENFAATIEPDNVEEMPLPVHALRSRRAIDPEMQRAAALTGSAG